MVWHVLFNDYRYEWTMNINDSGFLFQFENY